MVISFSTETHTVSSYNHVQLNYIKIVPVDNELGNWCIPEMTTNGMDIWPNTSEPCTMRDTPYPIHTHKYTHNIYSKTQFLESSIIYIAPTDKPR